MLPSRDREGVVADSLSDLSILKIAHWLLARSHFHGSIVSRRLMTNCATKTKDLSVATSCSTAEFTAQAGGLFYFLQVLL